MIRVNDDYVIELQKMNYIVKEDKHKKVLDDNGKEVDLYKVCGYYTSLESALEGVKKSMSFAALENGEYSLEEAITKIREINDAFVSCFEKAVGEAKEEVVQEDEDVVEEGESLE